jgi:mRNA interferase RelE/StbE
VSWQVEWSDRALKDAERLDKQVRARIVAAIERLANTQHGDVKQLHGAEAQWRLRVGGWRVRFRFESSTNTMRILRVLPRGRAYRD